MTGLTVSLDVNVNSSEDLDCLWRGCEGRVVLFWFFFLLAVERELGSRDCASKDFARFYK